MFTVSKGIGWEIRRDGGLFTIEVSDPEDLFNRVWELTDQETAIEVVGWAELAALGEVFEIRDIVIEVIDRRALKW